MSRKAVAITQRQAARFKLYGRHSEQGHENMAGLAELWRDKDPEISKLYAARAKHYEELTEIYAEMAEDAIDLGSALAARDAELGV